MAARKRSGWGGPRPGSGPKPLPEGERRRHAALVRMNDAERAALLRAAGGKPLATWLRDLGLRAARRRTK
ncbi:hypothetical protein KJ059_08080 [Myxococcota bacterium]|nr:hypothetical protein [Myxococcota bacterium]MCZ7618761.1 hypothetical protein [Myxococcota bacterium]